MLRFSVPAPAALALGLLLAGCAVGPDFRRPEPGAEDGVLAPRADGPALPALSDAAVPSAWWSLFDDPLLASLEQRAASANLDIEAASARVEQARAQLGIASAALKPVVGASADYARGANSENGPLAALGASTRPSDLWQVGVQAQWEIDLWGHARRLRESAGASAEASVYDRDAVRVAVGAEVARGYLLLRGVQARREIVRKNLDIARDALRIAESRERNGVATRFDSAAARSQLATTEALALQLAQQHDAAMNALALLLGQPPRALDAELRQALPLPTLPARIPVGLPSQLARRRPDILAAEARLHAATADIGVAQADFYPRIGLGGSVGLQSFESSTLSDRSSRMFSVGPVIHLPIFEGGRLKRTLALTEARAKSAAIAYRQAVLGAWHEVDDALGACAVERQRYAQLRIAEEQDRLALHVAERSWQEGTADYLAVLVAQRNLLASQSALADGATASSLALVALYRALGGGWDAQAMQAEATPDAAAAGLHGSAEARR